jgi:hypothetical protein
MEYVIPPALCLVLLVAIAWNGNLFQGLADHTTAAIAGRQEDDRVAVFSFGQVLLPASAKRLAVPEVGQESICFVGSRTCINIPVITPEVAGGLGGDSVKKMAVTIQEIARMMAEDNVEPGVVDLVTNLANRGHGLADELRAIQSLCSGQVVCRSPQSDMARSRLIQLKAQGLNAFLSDWQNLSQFMEANPTALANYPEAVGIIKGQVNDIQQLVSAIGAQDNQVVNSRTISQTAPDTSKRIVIPRNADVNTAIRFWQAKNQKTVQRNETTVVNDGVIFNNPGAQQVNRNANTICSQGGQTAGQGNCMRRAGGSAEWQPVE